MEISGAGLGPASAGLTCSASRVHLCGPQSAFPTMRNRTRENGQNRPCIFATTKGVKNKTAIPSARRFPFVTSKSEAMRSQEKRKTNRPKATSKLSINASYNAPTIVHSPILDGPIQGTANHPMAKIRTVPVKTPKRRARRSPSLRFSSLIRRAPCSVSASAMPIHVTRALTIISQHPLHSFRQSEPSSAELVFTQLDLHDSSTHYTIQTALTTSGGSTSCRDYQPTSASV